MKQAEMFNGEIDEFKTALERFGVWPTTVWDVDFSSPVERKIKDNIGDFGQRRENSLRATSKNSCWQAPGAPTASIFSPSVASWILNCFAPVGGGLCLDPFAGGGTRAIMSAKKGMLYLGVDIRAEEVQASNDRVSAAGVGSEAKIICGNSMDLRELVGDNSANFLMTCPPYWNLEKYSDKEGDLSNAATYDEFLEKIGAVIAETSRILTSGALSCWVVGMFRDKKAKLHTLHHDISNLHDKAGFCLIEEIVLAHRNNGAIQRVGNFDKGNKFLVRTHEYCLVFRCDK